ncbi:MAG: efflux RND transporter periplasmic adaptor subunit [Cytophagales bacterium]|nr:efflux RND transporter periplasmic adaptor subunit [Cytophagales bacterium]
MSDTIIISTLTIYGKRAKRIFIYFSLSLALFNCNSRTEIQQTDNTFPVLTVHSRDTVLLREYVAEIQSIKNVEIRSRVSGFIDKIYIDEGELVTKGQVLFTISNQSLIDDLAKAKASLNSIKADTKIAVVEYENSKKLFDKNIISDTEVRLAEAKVESMQAKVEEASSEVAIAEHTLSLTIIRAPFNGTINRIPFKSGSLISDGSLLTTISDITEMFAYFRLSESEYLEYLKYNEGIKNNDVQLILANNEKYPRTGKLETVESEIDSETGTIAFRARFKNVDHMLKHGASAKVLIPDKIDKTIIIPQRATLEIQEDVFVFIVDTNNIVSMKRIIPSLRMHNFYLVRTGLAENDRIVSGGIQKLNDGDAINQTHTAAGNNK